MTDLVSSAIVKPKRVRYIKLGEGGLWEQECLTKGTIRIGFDSAKEDMFAFCRTRRWEKVAAAWIEAGKTKGTATRFTNELRLYFEDDGSTLWITFIGERLCWGFVDRSAPQPHPDGHGVLRAICGGWRSTDRNGEELTKDRLSGALTKLAAYRGTSCDVDVAEYTVRRINGQKVPAVERALAVSQELKASVQDMMRLLTPGDFETLVDLVFSTSGWRRLGTVGGPRKTLDLDLILPSTGERAFVQVKSKTSPELLAAYIAKIKDGPYERMFYVFHSGACGTDDPRVTLMGPNELPEMVMDAGLVSWLIRKVS